MSVLYVGIDVAKLKLDSAATLDGIKVFTRKTVNNDASGFRALASWAREHARRQRCNSIHYCFESTGIYGQLLLEYLEEEPGAIVSMVNPVQVKGFASSLMLRTKTDSVDAELIARFACIMKPLQTEKTAPELKELRSLVRYRESLVQSRTEAVTRLEGTLNSIVRASIEETIRHYDEQIALIERRIGSHVDGHPGLKNDIGLLESIPGIGMRTACVMLVEMHAGRSDGKLERKAQTAHAGLAPGQRESGTSVRGKSRLCKTGNGRLRGCLYMPTMNAVRHNAVVREFYNMLVAKGKSKMVAMIAAMRKLLTIAIGVLNNQTPFDPAWKSVKLT